MPRVVTPKLKLPPVVYIKDFYERRNKIAIVRRMGGLGDILMHRMMFEDFKLMFPESHLVFACPADYHDAVYDHPFVDELIDFNEINLEKFGTYFDTTSACGRYESAISPRSDKNRSDIWAEHCGVSLTKHNMHIRLEDQYLSYGKDVISKYSHGRKTIVLAPVSAMATKNLLPRHIQTIKEEVDANGFSLIVLHNNFLELDVPVVHSTTIRQWMGVIAASDAVISADTAAFHFAGGIKKPLMGIFTFACGKMYGKWYDFILVQRHREDNGLDCCPCYLYYHCPKTQAPLKPCLTEIDDKMLKTGMNKLFAKL